MILAFAVSGMAAFSLGMARHYEQVFGAALRRRRALAWKCAGWLLLAASMRVAVLAEGVSVGLTLWTVVLTLAGLVVALLHSYAPRVVVPVGGVALVLAVTQLALSLPA